MIWLQPILQHLQQMYIYIKKWHELMVGKRKHFSERPDILLCLQILLQRFQSSPMILHVSVS